MKGDKVMQILGQYQDKFEQITDHSDWEKNTTDIGHLGIQVHGHIVVGERECGRQAREGAPRQTRGKNSPRYEKSLILSLFGDG